MPDAMAYWYAAESTASGYLITPTGSASDAAWGDTIMSPDGRIFGPPWHGTTQVVVWDTAAQTISSETYGLDFLESGAFAGMQGGQYGAGVFASDGKIYFAPWGEDRFLVIDPSTDTALKTDFGTPIGDYDPVSNTGLNAHSYGLVEGPNQKLYSIPYGLNRPPVIIDLNSQSAIIAPYADIKTGGAFQKFELWNGGALAPNGKIYCSPYNRAAEVLVIDTADDSATLQTFGLNLSGTYRFGRPCLGPDGKIYCPPYSQTACLVIDPTTETAVLEDFGLDLSGGFKYYSAGVGPDGKIYCPPSFASTGWLVIDPIAWTAFFQDLSNGKKGQTAVMDGAGRLYHIHSDLDYTRVDVAGAAGPSLPGFAGDAFSIWHPN